MTVKTLYPPSFTVTGTATVLPAVTVPRPGVRYYRYAVAVYSAPGTGYLGRTYYVLRAPSVALARAAVAVAYNGPLAYGPPTSPAGATVERVALGATVVPTPGYGLLTRLRLPPTPLPPNV